MNCYDKLVHLHNIINYQGDSFEVLHSMKISGELDKLMNELDIETSFKNSFMEFLRILTSQEFDKFPFHRTLFLHESEYLKLFKQFGYELGLFFNDKKIYKNLTNFFKLCINRYNIVEFKELSNLEIEILLSKWIDISKCYYEETKKELVQVISRYSNNCTNYTMYEEKIKNNTLRSNDTTEFFIWSEKETCNYEYKELSKYYPNALDFVKWIAKNNGDGYGFDVLSYDPILNHEKLIEVKSSHYNYFELTLKEYMKLYKIKDLEYCDYYVYFYFMSGIGLKVSKLKYDKQNNVFIDINNNDVYDIEIKMVPDEDKPDSYNNKITVPLVKQKVLIK